MSRAWCASLHQSICYRHTGGRLPSLPVNLTTVRALADRCLQMGISHVTEKAIGPKSSPDDSIRAAQRDIGKGDFACQWHPPNQAGSIKVTLSLPLPLRSASFELISKSVYSVWDVIQLISRALFPVFLFAGRRDY